MARQKKVKPEEVKETKVEPKVYFDDEKLEIEVLKPFFDKYTDKLYEIGKTYILTYKRIKEIKAKNEKLIKIIEK